MRMALPVERKSGHKAYQLFIKAVRKCMKIPSQSIESAPSEDNSMNKLVKYVSECRKCTYKGFCTFCINCGRAMKD